MYLSLNWLKQYINIPDSLSAEQLEKAITTSIAEVEGMKEIGQDGVVVGKVLKLEPHPNADRLKLVEVTTGTETHKVVCGGNNLREGMLVAFGRTGIKAKWHGQGDWVVLEKATIRGVESAGMILASEEVELPLPCPEGGITDLTKLVSAKHIGRNVFEVLGLRDVILEIDNKSLTHRPDLFGHYGFARDIAAVLKNQLKVKAKLKPYPQSDVRFGTEKLDIEIQTPGCRRMSALRVSNVKIEPSPLWMQNALQKVGIRPINNVVDITNYIMYDLGHPMHAFDAREIEGKKMIVAQARDGEKILALDGKEYTLTKDDMAIYDNEKLSSIAGIMGGEGSGIHDHTTEVIFEIASWDPVLIRKTTQRLNLRSEASTRFEKNLDPELTVIGLNRAVSLLLELCPGATVSSALFDTYTTHIDPKTIELRSTRAETKIGVPVKAGFIKSTLTDLGCTVHGTGKSMQVTVPSWRATKDLMNEDDLIEEVARVHGYNNIAPQAPEGALAPYINAEKQFERAVRRIGAERLGMCEVMNYPFTNETIQSHFGLGSNVLKVQNPIASQYTHLKNSLIPDLLDDAKENIHQFNKFALFEMGRTYGESGAEVTEEKKIGGIWVEPEGKKTSSYDDVFFRLKENLEVLFELLGIPERTYHPVETQNFASLPGTFFEKGKTALIMINNKSIGWLGVIKSDLKKHYDLAQTEVAVFELNQQVLQELANDLVVYQPLPKFPAVVRDLAILVDKTVGAEKVAAQIKTAHENVSAVELFDVYEGEKIDTDKRSLTFNITYLDPDKTLNESEIQEITGRILENVGKVGGKLRDL